MNTASIPNGKADLQTDESPAHRVSNMDERSFEVGIRQAEMGVTNDAAILENGKAAQNGDLSIAHTVASNTVSSGTSTTAVNAASERIENELNQDDHSITSDAPPLQAGLSVSNLPFEVTAPKKTKKRKARPGKTLRAVTGFENFYADAPTTPAEHVDEKKLYSTDLSFAQRIETAIQRYRQKRRFDSQRSFLFDKYLAIGGIDSSQRMFQGFDPSEAKDMTTDEIRQMTARDIIHYGVASVKFYDPDTSDGWRVDFSLVIKGFLSRWVPENYPRSDQGPHYDNEQAAGLVHNFLSYLQMHDVCPEYSAQILAAKAVCGDAPTELGHARELFYELQDSFNTSSKFLFCDGGVFEANTPSVIDGSAKPEDKEEFPGQDAAMRTRELDPFTQLVIFRLTVMNVNKDANHLAADNDPRNIRVESTKIETYQVIFVHRRKKKEKVMLEELLSEQGLEGTVKPAGTMILRPSMIEHAYSNIPHPDEIDFSGKGTEEFIVDDDILAKVQPGMKMQLEVCKLNIGVVFIKKVLDVRVTFDTLLPQSLMLTWKDPVPNERPAPSVDNPGLEDKTVGDYEIEM